MTKDGVKNVKTHDFGNCTLKTFPINPFVLEEKLQIIFNTSGPLPSLPAPENSFIMIEFRLPTQVFTSSDASPSEKRFSAMFYDPKRDRLITGNDIVFSSQAFLFFSQPILCHYFIQVVVPSRCGL